MASHPSQSKIQSEHLDRDAVIYVRQSSLMQVRDNTASTMRQYDLYQIRLISVLSCDSELASLAG